MIVHRKCNYAEALSEGLMLFHALIANPRVAEDEVNILMVQGQLTLKYKGRTLLTVDELNGEAGQCNYHQDDAVLALVPTRTPAPSAGTSIYPVH